VDRGSWVANSWVVDCRVGFGAGLDEQLLPFLKLSAFCAKVACDDVLKMRIQNAYKHYQLTDDQLTPEQLAIKANMPDWKADILLPLRTTMESDAFKDYDMVPIYEEVFRKYRQSRYQNIYGYPLEITCGKDIFDNVNKVLKALDYYSEVGDNRLVPDVD